MGPAQELIAGYEPHPHVALVLGATGHAEVSFDLETDPAWRGQGLATIALWDLVEQADECGCAIRIRAEPGCGMRSVRSLMVWYARFGFVQDGPPDQMVRMVEHHR